MKIMRCEGTPEFQHRTLLWWADDAHAHNDNSTAQSGLYCPLCVSRATEVEARRGDSRDHSVELATIESAIREGVV